MKIHIQFLNIASSETTKKFTKKKLQKIFDKHQDIIRAEVMLKSENDPSPKGEICEIKLSLPGPLIFASSNEESIEASIVETISDLERQLNKRKGKLRTYS